MWVINPDRKLTIFNSFKCEGVDKKWADSTEIQLNVGFNQ